MNLKKLCNNSPLRKPKKRLVLLFYSCKYVLLKYNLLICSIIDFVYINSLFFTPGSPHGLHHKHFCYQHMSFHMVFKSLLRFFQ